MAELGFAGIFWGAGKEVKQLWKLSRLPPLQLHLGSLSKETGGELHERVGVGREALCWSLEEVRDIIAVVGRQD